MSRSTVRRAASLVAAATLSLLLGGVLTSGTASANPGVAWVGPNSHKSEAVRCVQSALGLQIDSLYGDETMHAIREVQSSAGLEADGVVGPQTGDYLLPRTFNPKYCANRIPTTYSFVVDDSTTPPPPPGDSTVGAPGPDVGAVESMGKPLPECIAKQIEGNFTGLGRIAKVVWKRKLPAPSEWLKAPNPITTVGGVSICYIFED